MQNYTEEEAAILCGFIGRYIDRDSICDTVRSAYSRLCKGLEQHTLTHQDYRSTISDAPMVDGAGRSPCAGLTFTENAVLDSGNTIILNG